MQQKTNLRRTIRSAALIGLTSALGMSTAVAQDNSSDDEMLEEILVTGSRVVRTELESVSPIQIIGETEIEFSGVNSVATLLNELPAAGVPGSVDTATNFRSTTTGLNTLNLRNLGSQRTLILVNGRRHIGGSAGTQTVDVSMIPISLVERVEVVTGGASVAYGSEAISGVVNFIMKDDFEGVEIDTRYAESELGGADETDFSVMLGGNFAEGQGNAVFYAGHSDRGILNSRDRDLSANDAVNSTFGPKGNFFVPGTGFITLDENTGLWDKPFVAAEDGFNRNAVRVIRVPSKRTQFNANIRYEINDHVNVFSESAYNELTSFSRLEPSIVGEFISVGPNIPNIRVPINNPYMPTELRDAVLAGDPTATEVTMARRFVEVGPRTSDVQRRIFRSAIGVDGDINDNWRYEAYYQFGNFGQDQTNGGVFNSLNFYNSLNAEDDGSGGIQCADAFARSIGCVPVNVFGAGSISGDALDWVSVDSQLTVRMEQEVFSGHVSGSVFELPAGDVGVAFGYEWREEESRYNSDSLAQSGLTSGNTLPNTVGSYTASEFFAEAVVPLVEGAPGADYLGLELAARYSDYDTIGDNVTYRASLDWSPLPDLKIRGGVSTAVRAPNINELFNPGSETFRNFVDPCALGGAGGTSSTGEVYETQSAAVQAACAQIPGTATLDPFGLNIRSAGGLAAGNPSLTEEESDAVTVGFVYSPSFVDNLNITVDYFNITIDSAINAFTAQTTVDQCVRQPTFPNNAFCDLIQRDPTTGLVLRIDALAINVAEFEAEGIDFAIDYGMEAGPGSLTLNLYGTHSMANDFVPFAGGNIVDSQGEVGVPDWKINFASTYILDNMSFAWSTRYIGDVNVENDSISAFGTIPSYTYHDLQARYSFGADRQYDVFLGVDNVFDKEPPFLGQGIPGDITGTNTASDVYDVIRRFYYVGFRAGFDL